jgi:hypothetical protein
MAGTRGLRMILRRLARSLHDQNWAAIAIEFLLLVLGVFLGIQVANWNQANGDRRIVDKYLADIAADIRADIQEAERTNDSAKLRMGASTYLLREAGVAAQRTEAELIRYPGFERIAIPEVAPPPVQRNRLWSDATKIYMYDALVSSGRIELIDDPRITRALREYYYIVSTLSATQIRTLVPMRQRILEAGIENGHSPWGVADEAVLVEQIRSDPGFATVVATSGQLAAVQLLISSALDEKARSLLPLLEKERRP